MNADMCMLNLLTIEFAAAGNQKSVETLLYPFAHKHFVETGYIYYYCPLRGNTTLHGNITEFYRLLKIELQWTLIK